MKTYKVNFTDKAKSCLFEISKYIALDNPYRAETFIDELVDSIYTTLSVFPLGSPKYKGLKSKNSIEIRLYAYEKYNCYYYFSESTQTVTVLYVFNAAKQVKKLLDEYLKNNSLG